MKNYLLLSLSWLYLSSNGMENINKITMLQHSPSIENLIVNPAGNLIYCIARDLKSYNDGKLTKTLEIYNFDTGTLIKTDEIRCKPDFVYKPQFCKNSACYVLTDTNSQYELHNLKEKSKKTFSHTSVFLYKNNTFFDDQCLCNYYIERGSNRLYSRDSSIKSLTLYNTDDNTTTDLIWNYTIKFCIPNWGETSLTIIMNNRESYYYDLETKRLSIISNKLMDRYPDSFYATSSDYLWFFDAENSTVNLYDFKTANTFTKKTDQKIVSTRIELIGNLLVFSCDHTCYAMWDFQGNTIKSINLKTLCDINSVRISPRKAAARLIYFTDKHGHFACNIQTETLFCLPEKTTFSSLTCNASETHVIYIKDLETCYIYTTHDWNLVATINFEKSKKLESCGSPCGNFICIYSDNQLKLYSLAIMASIFDKDYKEISFSKVQFYRNNIIVFAVDEKKLIIYDYLLDKAHEIVTEQPITYFTVEGSYVCLTCERQTEIFDLSGTTKNHKNLYNFNDFDLNFIYQ